MTTISSFLSPATITRNAAPDARAEARFDKPKADAPKDHTYAPAMGAAGSNGVSLVRGDTAVAAQEETRTIEKPSAREEFLAYQKMTPEQKYRAQFLKQLGLTEEELAQLPPEEREKIEAKLRKMIKEAIEEDIKEKQREGASGT